MLAFDYPLLNVFLPFVGVFIHLVARGAKMHDRQIADAAAQRRAFDQYVQQTAGTADVPSQLEKLASLRDQHVLSPQESETQKSKLLA